MSVNAASALPGAVADGGGDGEVLMTQEDVAEIIRTIGATKGAVHGRNRPPSVVDSPRDMRGSAGLTVLDESSLVSYHFFLCVLVDALYILAFEVRFQKVMCGFLCCRHGTLRLSGRH